jgi:cleavage and polyadenylation specificity factor subunit 1
LFSLLPHSSSEPPRGPPLTGPAGGDIACWGEKKLELLFSGRQFSWQFLLAAVAFPIIGMDFLQAHRLLVDVAGRRLVSASTGQSLSLTARRSGPTAAVLLPGSPGGLVASSPSAPARLCAVVDPEASPPPRTVQRSSRGELVQQLLADFPQVVNASGQLPPTSHGVTHHLRTSGPPISSPFRRLDAEKLAAAKAEFDTLLRDGVVRRSDSPWASPLHMVRKADGTWRPCGDYRRLNGVTVPDSYPLPNMMDFAARLEGCRVFSKLDLRKGYHQIPMHEADIPKTAIVTPFGLFEYTRMTFGMRNAGNTFQRLMDRVLHGSAGFAYLDDVLVASGSVAEHMVHLRDIFRRLSAAGLVLNAEKCLYAVDEVDFLGHHVTAAGIAPLDTRVAAIQRHPRPNTVQELMAFLGTVNFYRRFVPQAARILRPLTEALKGGRPLKSAVDWTAGMEVAFTAAKEALAHTTVLAHPSQGAEMSLMVDASDLHVGAVLQQRSSPGAAWRPLGFFSQKLSPAESRYSAFDRELLACVAGIKHFRYLLEGRRWVLYTDHKPLTFALSKVSEPWTARQARHLSYVAEYTSDIRHVAGKQNVVADMLSRPPAVCAVPASADDLDYAAIAEQQRNCPTVEEAKSSSLKLALHRFGELRILCDSSLPQLRPLIPLPSRRRVFAAFHNLAHAGARATRRTMAARVVWVGMARDINAWCRECQDCARGKVTRQPAAPVEPIPVPSQRFSHVHVDVVGPLPTSREGFRYLLTMVDRSSRWLEAIPLRSVEAATCAEAFIAGWVARFGVPGRITTDRGRQFISSFWGHVCGQLGAHHSTTTAFHPQSNGMVERCHRQLKDALKARLAAAAWPSHLPWVLLGLRTAPKEDSGVSSAELVYMAPLSLPAQLAADLEAPLAPLVERFRQLQPPPVRHVGLPPPSGVPAALADVEMVYIRKGGSLPPLTPPYAGPYHVLKRGTKFFTVQLGDRVETVSVDRLKPHLGLDSTRAATPPVRGRPRLAAGGRDARSYAAVVAGGE